MIEEGAILKKAVIFTAAVLAAFGGAWLLSSQQQPEVQLVSMKQLNYTETFSVSGVVESPNQRDLTLDYPVIPKKVLVKEGDSVSFGDAIATVDREATVQAVAALAQQYTEELPEGIAGEIEAAFSSVSEKLTENLDFIPETITAPMTGVITSLSLTAGELALPTSSAVTVSTVESLQLRLYVPESQMGLIDRGTSFTFTASAVPDGLFAADILRFSPSAYQKLDGLSYQTVVDVVAKVEDTFNALRPGYTVQAEIPAGEEEILWLLPYEAVLQDETGQDYVYVYQEGEVVRRDVETGRELTTSVQITEGLSRYEKVIQDAESLEGEGPVLVAGGDAAWNS